jgi:hypothetical protein
MKERLFRLGVDPRVVSSANGHTLLHAACGFGASKIAKLVVRRAVYESHPPFRAFLDARANDGSAALDVATNAGFERIAEWLTALGASSGFRSAFEAPGVASVSRSYANTRTNATTDPAFYPPAFYPPPFANPIHVGVGTHGAGTGTHPPLPPSVPSVDAYLFGALESVLGDLEEPLERPSDAGPSERDDRARARRLVKRVAELAEDRDDYRADLEAALRRAERAEAKLAKTRDALLVAESARAAASSEARDAVARQAGGGAEGGAGGARFGGAEGGAHGGRARDPARGARRHRGGAGVRQGGDEGALLEHLEHLEHLERGTGLPSFSRRGVGKGAFGTGDDGRGARRRNEGYRTAGGGVWERSRTPKWDRATRVTTPRASRRCWRCPSGTETRRGARPRLARVRERSYA